jgi:hypothetical protein
MGKACGLYGYYDEVKKYFDCSSQALILVETDLSDHPAESSREVTSPLVESRLPFAQAFHIAIRREQNQEENAVISELEWSFRGRPGSVIQHTAVLHANLEDRPSTLAIRAEKGTHPMGRMIVIVTLLCLVFLVILVVVICTIN